MNTRKEMKAPTDAQFFSTTAFGHLMVPWMAIFMVFSVPFLLAW